MHEYIINLNKLPLSSCKRGRKRLAACQGQLLEGVECHIYLYCFTFDDINLNRALVIIVLFPTKYSNKKVCANDIQGRRRLAENCFSRTTLSAEYDFFFFARSFFSAELLF